MNARAHTQHNQVATYLLEWKLALLLKGEHEAGEGEGERLPGTGERHTDHVPAGQEDGQGLHLDRRGLDDALVCEVLGHGGVELQVNEAWGWVGRVGPIDLDVKFCEEVLADVCGHITDVPVRVHRDGGRALAGTASARG